MAHKFSLLRELVLVGIMTGDDPGTFVLVLLLPNAGCIGLFFNKNFFISSKLTSLNIKVSVFLLNPFQFIDCILSVFA